MRTASTALLIWIALLAVSAVAQNVNQDGGPYLKPIPDLDRIEIPISISDGHRVMVPLSLTNEPDRVAIPRYGNSGRIQKSPRGYTWSFFPMIDASEKIVFSTRAAVFWATSEADQ